MKLNQNLLYLFIAAFFMACSSDSGKDKQQSSEKTELEQFQDLKFGMFVHWGPVSLRGTEIGWSRGREVPIEEYDTLYKAFNPIHFNADEWIGTLKEAGMKYFIITSRHHDGFSIWPSEFSEYDIMATPYKKDVLMDMKNACEKHGILFGTYYSICDWKHPDYPRGSPGGRTVKESGDMEKFIPFVKGQTRELIEKYNTRILWFDGEWEEPWTHEMGLDLYDYLKQLDEKILINNRVDKGRKGMEGITISDEFAGDFATPEQRVGAYDIENPWESCITICKQWAWKPDDEMKSLNECLSTLIKTVGGGGNLLFNVGPMPDGRIEPRQVERLKEMGAWLKENGEAIYETKGGPYKPQRWLASTRKNNKIYLHLMDYGNDRLILPFPREVKIKSCRILNGEKLDYKVTGSELSVDVSSLGNNSINVIELSINQEAEKLETIELN